MSVPCFASTETTVLTGTVPAEAACGDDLAVPALIIVKPNKNINPMILCLLIARSSVQLCFSIILGLSSVCDSAHYCYLVYEFRMYQDVISSQIGRIARNHQNQRHL